MRSVSRPVVLVLLVAGVVCLRSESVPETSSSATSSRVATATLERQPGFFVPNLGQWDRAARFVHRSGPMTLFLEDRGWVLDLVAGAAQSDVSSRSEGKKVRGCALRMTFEGDARVPGIRGEKTLPGHHDYFLGNDETRWRTDVPMYASVRYTGLYPGIDLRLREAAGVPEYDLLLEPGADLASVRVRVEGATSLSIAADGSLVVHTALGTVTQPVPKTWEVRDGDRREVVCRFELLGADRFGFVAPGWDGATNLTIDPGLIWSSFLGGSVHQIRSVVAVDAEGVMTVAGVTGSTDFPTRTGAYDRTLDGRYDLFISRLDPRLRGTAQLVSSTYLGGPGGGEWPTAIDVDSHGVVTVVGVAGSGFPTTSNAFDTTFNGDDDVFVVRLDPGKSGSAQLVYSTYLGGSLRERVQALHVDARGVVSLAGSTASSNFPTTSGAYDRTYSLGDGYVVRLDPSKSGSAQLAYSTFLGGERGDSVEAIFADGRGVLTVGGGTGSLQFPITKDAYDTTFNGTGQYRRTAFLSRLDPSKSGSAQLVYSTFFGGTGLESIDALAVDARGVVTVAGGTSSRDLPVTSGAYDTTANGGQDVFVSRLDPSKSGNAQLLYSTYLGGRNTELVVGIHVDAIGVVTVGGGGNSTDFPTTIGAFDTTFNGFNDAFVSRLDPRATGARQLVYSTYLGGTSTEHVEGLAVDPSGVVTVTGSTGSTTFPTTSWAYDPTFNSQRFHSDVYVSRLDMGVALYGDVHEIPIAKGGSQQLTIHAGKAHANKSYQVFGSVSGTTPGIKLLGIDIPLNPDPYTDIVMAASNSTVFTKFKGTLDADGRAIASFHIPANQPIPPGLTFHHAYLVYDASRIYMASNAVPLRAK